MSCQECDPALSIHDVSTVIQLRQLLKNGTDVNQLNAYDETPLMSALRREVDPRLIQELVYQGADVHAKNLWEEAPLYFAVAKRARDSETIKFLLEHGADIAGGKVDSDRLLEGTLRNNRECVELLIKYKFKRNFPKFQNFKINILYRNKRDFYRQYKRIVELDLKPSCYLVLSNYLDSCASEFLQMRSVYLYGSLTLEKFLTLQNPFETIPDHHTMFKIIIKIFKELAGDKYPIYEDLIKNQIGNKELLGILETKIAQFCFKFGISTQSEKILMNMDLMHIITQYLTTYEFVMLLIAYPD
ncbi:ANK_REP_REGION domain-containing protein [Trichonephila inaurata madagascariensis]|uniref:ANK_REP_REGION domain-containing protein n=1 Tax=Trichonephila inaurata madagascariensis TaxID=2747483 RepID=A0A8X7CP80_9ARAC|nr:ANK_REP_REGION domain-containing protein [Trichonephila inaurata madagascariensis]